MIWASLIATVTGLSVTDLTAFTSLDFSLLATMDILCLNFLTPGEMI